ncbi:PaaI family thioesterase [Stappia sp. ES.058]|uniref:PaaI family thioesterase n=1 Tax=Stappia sp. ES.058 TaxID=1881061 RepID=UPI00087D7B4E|nr:PaaI family thioesterase [Stappia sp. ES.058]SDU20328.1 uncharacterized domain 1-containing protein [Stappia sp. ES.058]
MTGMAPRDTDWETRVRTSFARQAFMATLGAEIVALAPGRVELGAAFHPGLTQQHGFFHAGVTSTLADSAAGYAALSLFGAGHGVLTTEFKMNLLNPGRGERMRAVGRVIKPGRTLTVASADVYGVGDFGEVHIATGLFTMIAMPGIED